jgi:Ca2+-binding RTX toxin-like protein
MPTPTSWSTFITTPLSNNNNIDSLLWGVNWLSNVITYSYPTTGSVWSTSSTSGYGPSTGNGEPWSTLYDETSQSDRKFIAQMLQKWTNVADLTFTEVSDTPTNVGDIRFAYSYDEDNKDAQAWTYYPGPRSSSGDMWFNALGTSATKEFKPGTYVGFTLLHELGHAIGLKHPFSASARVDSILTDSLDSQSFTVMSYSSSTNELAKSATYFPTTPMLLDIQAIQYMYGANYKYNAGDNNYLYSDNIDYRETIWDGGGIDSVNYSGTRDAIIDLRQGYGSQIGNPIYSLSETGSKISTLKNLWIAYGVTIENSFGGSGNDEITGNDANNSLNGGNGNDRLYGGKGNDTFDWDSTGRGGNDTFYGGVGDDTYVINSTLDSIIENTNEGIDTVWVSFSYSLADLPNIENIGVIGTTGVSLIGNAAKNSFKGSSGNDNLNGGLGLDKAIYQGNKSNYTLIKGTDTYSISDKTGIDGIDTLTNVERLQFSDQTLALDINGTAGQAYRIYQAAFNRTPDTGGLKYWIEAMDSGVSLSSVSSGFIGSAEFQKLYGTSPTNELFVTKLYDNVLHRAPDTGGYNYWVGLLNSGGIDKVSTLVNFSESNENQAGVIGVIQNGIDLFN